MQSVVLCSDQSECTVDLRRAEVKQTGYPYEPCALPYHRKCDIFGIFLDVFNIFKALSAFYALAMNLFKFELRVH